MRTLSIYQIIGIVLTVVFAFILTGCLTEQTSIAAPPPETKKASETGEPLETGGPLETGEPVETGGSLKPAVPGIMGGSSETDSPVRAHANIIAFDAPVSDRRIEEINLDIQEVSIHHADSGWIVVSSDALMINFLELINGKTKVLSDMKIITGKYSQLRLMLGEDNTVKVAGESFPLDCGSAKETGIKLQLNYDIKENDSLKLYLDFDASKSIIQTKNKFILKPVIKVFNQADAGRITGTVSENGIVLPGVAVEAKSKKYSSATLTDLTGNYTLILPSGKYSVTAHLSTGLLATAPNSVQVIKTETSAGIDIFVTP